jgi:hypothetical protein
MILRMELRIGSDLQTFENFKLIVVYAPCIPHSFCFLVRFIALSPMAWEEVVA